MTYLFFDLECANSFGGIGKMCSFGYVLCDSDFSIIESDDILMNPLTPFDWYLFKKDSRCRLAYSRETYQQQPPFAACYERIKTLLTVPDRVVIGFGCKNDISTIACDCIRAKLPLIDFCCHDIHPLLEKHYEAQGGLGAFVKRLSIDTKEMQFHDSRADAYFTMKVTERLCASSEKPLAELLKAYMPATSAHTLKDVQRRLYRKYLERELAAKSAPADGSPATAKPVRIPKKLRVPKDFDWQAEFFRTVNAKG